MCRGMPSAPRAKQLLPVLVDPHDISNGASGLRNQQVESHTARLDSTARKVAPKCSVTWVRVPCVLGSGFWHSILYPSPMYCWQQEKYQEAIDIYLEALDYSPENPELLTTVGLLYLRLGENFKAFDYLGLA